MSLTLLSILLISINLDVFVILLALLRFDLLTYFMHFCYSSLENISKIYNNSNNSEKDLVNQFKKLDYIWNREAYSEPSRTSMRELFYENCKRLLAIYYFCKKLYRRCSTGVYTRLWNDPIKWSEMIRLLVFCWIVTLKSVGRVTRKNLWWSPFSVKQWDVYSRMPGQIDFIATDFSAA